jgi:hypothetical protein
MKTDLTGLDWARIGVSFFLITLSAYCALQAVVSGMAHGAIVGVHGKEIQVAELQHNGQRYLLACILLQGLTTLVLGRALRIRAGTSNDSSALPRWPRYLIAFIISLFGTLVSLGALIWILEKS